MTCAKNSDLRLRPDATDSVVAARCARGGRHGPGSRAAFRLPRRGRRHAGRGRTVERARRLAARRRAHVARADRPGARVRRLRTPRRTPSGSGIPRRASFTPVPYGRNLFCAGHVQLAGRPDAHRRRHTSTPTSGSPTRRSSTRRRRRTSAGPDMSVGRWYPTATQLPDGRVLAVRRRQHRPGPARRDAAVLGRVGRLAARRSTTRRRTRGPTCTSAKLTSPLYPFMFVLSRRAGLRRRPRHDDANPRPGDVDVVDGRRRARSTA